MPGVGWVTGRRVLGPGVTRAAASSQTPASRAEGRRRGEPTQSTGLDTRAGKLQSFHKSLIMVIWEKWKQL